MRYDDIRICEGILKDYSAIRSAWRMREAELMAIGPNERVDGGVPIPQQQRVVEDVQYMRLLSIVDGISKAVRDLPEHQQRAVVLIYLVGMDREEAAIELNCDVSTVRRRCIRGISHMRYRLLAIYERVVCWREEQAAVTMKEYAVSNST